MFDGSALTGANGRELSEVMSSKDGVKYVLKNTYYYQTKYWLVYPRRETNRSTSVTH